MAEPTPNRLAGETSPYLLQHAHNPVDWFPWGDEALARASEQDRPIFLSIGYAACHWCHVMERESFEDDETAALMNASFVSIKVDREERPDLDGIYMDAVQALTGQGGWPMSAFLTPDGRPFYAGTYYPPEPRHGMPSFRQVLTGIAEAWDERRDDIVAQASRITEAIGQVGRLEATAEPLTDAIAADRDGLAAHGVRRSVGRVRRRPEVPAADDAGVRAPAGRPWGGRRAGDGDDHAGSHGRRGHLRPRRRRLRPVLDRRRMARAALREDALRQRAAGAAVHARLAGHGLRPLPPGGPRRPSSYLLREMQQPDGGFSSSQDADSEGVEGKFFTWSWDELVGLVGEAVAECFGAAPGGNWAGEDGEGTNVLWRPVAVAAVARERGHRPRRAGGRRRGAHEASCSRRATRACIPAWTTRS